MKYQTTQLTQASAFKFQDHANYISPDLKILNKLKDLIEQNFRSKHDHEFYAQFLNSSLIRINGLTRFYLNRTIYELLQERIHEEAKHLLKNTSMSAKEISYELGICDPSYFGKWFKRREGLTPNKYRHQGNY